MNPPDPVVPPPVPRPMDIAGDHPGPRCGHTLTAVYANETDPNTSKLILFGTSFRLLGGMGRRVRPGGATALEGGQKGTPDGGGGGTVM